MSDIITEALLEMHYHQAIVKLFSRSYGAKFLTILKPSPQQEAWVGFDQGWARINATTDELFKSIKAAIRNRKKQIKNFYIGYFLQFKPVQRINRKSKHIPPDYDTPYYRSELSLKPNKTNGLSQHETLLRLREIKNAFVYYACAFLLELNDVYKKPNLDCLKCVDLKSSPEGWATNERHFLTFQNGNDNNPMWCSEPISAKTVNFNELISSNFLMKFTGDEVIKLIGETVDALKPKSIGNKQEMLFKDQDDPVKYLPESFTLMEFRSEEKKRRRIDI